MTSDVTVLPLLSKKWLPEDTFVHQTDDGTIFYHHFMTKPYRLYVIWEGQEIDAELPDEEDHMFYQQGNALYFHDKQGKFYKATFAPPTITVTYLRDIHDDESFSLGVCFREIGRDEFVYRLGDSRDDFVLVGHTIRNPSGKGIPTHVHRGKIIHCLKTQEPHFPKAKKFLKNVVFVHAHDISKWYVNDKYKCVIMSNGREVYQLNTDTLEITSFRIAGVERIFQIVGINDGLLTVTEIIEDDSGNCDFYMYTAQLAKQGELEEQ